MTTDTKVNELIINKLTKAQYDGIATKNPNELYFITDDTESFVSTVNGVAPVNGNVTIDIPSKTSDLTNDSGFITKSVSDLVNYYTKTEVTTELGKKQDNLSEAQLAAANSGITAEKVAKYDAFDEGKQDKLSDTQMAAVNSGITATKVAAYDLLDGTKADKATTLAGYGITDAYTKTEVDNKLASVYRYKGSVDTYADLPTTGMVQGDVYNVKTADAEHGIKAGDNVAWVDAKGEVAGHWDVLSGLVDLSNYYTKSEVNTELAKKQDNLSEAQLAAANSGVTAEKVTAYDTHVANGDIHVTAAQKTEWSAKQAALTETQMAAVNSGITAEKVTKYDNFDEGKQDKITGAATTITDADLTADKVVISNASGKIAVSTVTSTELGYLAGVTSAVQTQLNSKVDANSAITAATHTKITYDAKGLVTAGADLEASDIPSLTLAKISDVTSTAAELNELHEAGAVKADFVKLHALTSTADEMNALHEAGAVKADFEKLHAVTVSATEINYLDGVTSKVQDQIDAKSAVTIRQW